MRGSSHEVVIVIFIISIQAIVATPLDDNTAFSTRSLAVVARAAVLLEHCNQLRLSEFRLNSAISCTGDEGIFYRSSSVSSNKA